MKSNNLDSITEELFSVPPLIFRSVRKKLFKTALASISEDISPPHFEIMKILDESGTLHVTEIGERLQIPRPQMTHLIDKLVALDMVERQTDAADRRTINIMLTGKGSMILEEHEKLIRGTIKKLLSPLSNQDLAELSVSLRKIRDILSKLQ